MKYFVFLLTLWISGCPPLWAQDTLMYRGKFNDGASTARFALFTPAPLNQYSPYAGRFSDGFATARKDDFVPAYLVQFTPYAGRTGDGYTAVSQSNFAPEFLTHFTPYAGKFGDGYAGALIVGVSPLPVSLLAFDGRREEKTNFLEWRVAEEVSVARYELQRSTDAQNWNTIYSLPVLAGKNIVTIRNFRDKEPLEGKNFYRLRITETDGSSPKWSNTVLLVRDPTTNVFVTLAPNPAGEVVRISHNLTEKITIAVYDGAGRRVLQQAEGAGNNSFNLQVENLSAGMYLLQLQSGTYQTVIRFIKK